MVTMLIQFIHPLLKSVLRFISSKRMLELLMDLDSFTKHLKVEGHHFSRTGSAGFTNER